MPGPFTKFFTLEEAVAVEALAERVFPATEDGPGASDAHVTAFLDGQLAGPWGQGDRMYRDGPFVRSEHPGHGWQSPFTPGEAFQYGLAAIGRYVSATYGGQEVAELGDEELDQVLETLSNGGVDTFGPELSSKGFFSFFFDSVMEGLFSDPMYGGNHNCVGWRWVGFPGDPNAYGEPYSELFGKQVNYVVEPKGIRPIN